MRDLRRGWWSVRCGLVWLLLGLAGQALAATPFTVLDVSERTLDDAPALAVLFSEPLRPDHRYDGYISITDSKGAEVNGSWVLGENKRMLFFPRIQPQQSYTVLVRRGLPAAGGAVLREPVERAVRTRPMPPTFDFASRGSVLPARLSDGLPIMTINVPEVDIQFLRVRDNKLSEFINRFLLNARVSRWELQHLSPMLESIYITRFTTGAKANTRTVTHIPVEDIKELKRPGVYVAVMTRPGEFGYNAERITYFHVSDIGLHARLYADHMQVHTSSLASSRALPNIEIDLLNEQGKSIERVTTNATGHARLAGRARAGQLLVARSGGQLSLLAFRDPALDLSEFDINGPSQNAIEAFVYADRDLYRPGENAYVSVLLRDADGRAVAPQPLRVVLKQPDGKEIMNATWQPQTRGYYMQTIAIPSDAATGLWTLEVRADPAAQQPGGLLRLHVEEFLPERMKLDLTSAQAAPRYDQPLPINVEGAYLYGAPASGNRFTAVMNVRRDKNPIAALPGFVFGDTDDDSVNRREELPETTLNDKGQTSFEVKPFSERPRSPMLVRVTGSVYESGGRPVTRSIARTVWPAPAMVGIRPSWSGEFAPNNALAQMEVVRADATGKLLPAKGLDIKVIREDRNYYWSYDDSRGWHYEFSEAQYPVHTQTLALVAGGRGTLAVPVEWGSYRVEILDPETGLTTRYRFRAGWDWEARQKQNSARPDRVVIRLDKAAYRAGDTARVTITPPHDGEAVIMVEGDRPLWMKRVSIKASGGAVSIPIAKDWNRHDLYVSAVVFRAATAKDKITPNRAMGVAHLPLDRNDRKLDVKIDAPKKMKPDTKLRAKLKLPGLKGQQAMVTVAAVDVGILNITDFKTPDPFAHFFGKRRYGVESYDLYSRVIENLRGVRAKLRFGGDADASGLRKDKRAKSEVRTVALFSGPVKVSQTGEAEVTLPVPDFNGTLRLMAVAFTDDRFGAAESEVTVAAAVVAEIATPRFLGAGDQSALTLDVQNLSGQKQDLTVKLSATAPLRFTPVNRALTLDNQQKRTLRFDLGAEQAFGVGRIDLSVDGQGLALKRHWELGVRPAWPGDRRVSQKAIANGQSVTLNAASAADLMDKTVEGQLVVSSLPPLNLRSAVQNLLNYPYGCLEQTTSAAYPHVYVDETKATELGLKPLTLKERAERIEKAVARLATMQLAGGGFALWGNTGSEEPWLSPYATNFLLDAREQGFSVPDGMLNKALNNLQRRLQASGGMPTRDRYSDSPAHVSFSGNAYAAYVLARVQRAPLGTLRTMHDHQRSQSESGLPLVHLGLALKLQGDERRALEAIREGVAKARRERWYLGDYGSDVRDNGLMYALLERHGIAVDGKDRLLYALGTELGNRPYLSTQERFAVFLAGHNALRNAGQPWTGMLKVGGAEEKIEGRKRLVRAYPIDDLRKGVTFTSQSSGTLYTAIEITGYRKSAPPPKLDQMNIVRAYYTPDGKPLENRVLRVGELLLAHVRVESRNVSEDALVVDLLPAGLEVENLNISQGESLRDMQINGVNPIEAMQAGHIKHQEYRDDRFVAAVRLSGHDGVNLFYLVRVVSPGVYTVPPPFVEHMYKPERHAIGATPATLRVENHAP